MRLFFVFSFLICSPVFGQLLPQSEPQGDYWLRLNGFGRWGWDADHDGDGLSLRAEYFGRTDPRDANSRISPGLSNDANGFELSWNSAVWARYQIISSPTLRDFQGDADSIFLRPALVFRWELRL
ncbi:hypothetical protein N9B29_01755 [bacterium]|nr:hypothetical protein [bacterium]